MTTQIIVAYLNQNYSDLVGSTVKPADPVGMFTYGAQPLKPRPTLAQLLELVNGLLAHAGEPLVGVTWDPKAGGKFVVGGN